MLLRMFQNMMKTIHYTPLLVFLLLVIILPSNVIGQGNFDRSGIRFYEKRERNIGTQFHFNKEREEMLTDESKQYEELSAGELKLTFENRYWTFLDFKQEQLDFDIEVGPILGNGTWNDSNYVANSVADQSIFGLRFNGAVNYLNRFYYNDKSYTLVQINAKGRFDLYHRNSEGFVTDSNDVITDFDTESDRSKLRYGFTARAGWGAGRLNPVNHLMVADYLFDEYFNGRTFSEEESRKVILEIEKIKGGRTISTGHNSDKEAEQFLNFVNQQMLLTRPDNFKNEWKYGEFLPRFSGSRIEVGPFFSYYSREPDFIFGGYIQYDNEKYCSYKWNRKFNVALSYNWYKMQDWMRAEVDLGWSYFIQLRSQIDFGIKYVPGITLNYFENIGRLNHAFIPYIGYYSQLSETARVNFAFAYRIAGDEELMLPGPEFSVSIYRSRY